MKIFFKNNSKLVAVAAVMAVFASSAYADDASIGTGGYARQMHTMNMMKMIDANGDHMVSAEEYGNFYSAAFDRLDTNKDGTLDVSEWTSKGSDAVTIGTGGYNKQLRNVKVMSAMDGNADHKVSKEEFIAYHDSIFKSMDTKGDGMITASQWAKKLVGGHKS